jgi:serine/threonine-protein kinase
MPDDELKGVADARLGRVLRGKYRLDRVLGIGGMATVYAATHRNKKRFAIKMLHPELSVRENIRTRFLREGYVANSVGHSGAVAVLDDDIAEDGSAFLVMELLDGSALDVLARRWRRRASTRRACRLRRCRGPRSSRAGKTWDSSRRLMPAAR